MFPVELINQTYDLEQAGFQLIGMMFMYFILFLYFDQVIPNEYGISKKPLFFLDYFRNSHEMDSANSKESTSLVSETDYSDISSAQYHESIGSGNNVISYGSLAHNRD